MDNTYLLFIFALLLSNDRIGHLQMLDIATSLLAKLKAQLVTPELTLLINRLDLMLTTYHANIIKWQGDKSRSLGKVDNFTKVLLTVPFVLDTWKTAVKTAMPGDKNVLLVLFGNDISRFYQGKQADILRAFENLFELMHDYSDLTALQLKVADFIVVINGSFDSKTTVKDNVVIDSKTINNSHKLLGGLVLGTFGRLIDDNQLNPFIVESYFDRSVMKRNEKDPDKLRVNQSMVLVTAGITVNAAQVEVHKKGYLVFESKVDVPVIVWTAASASSPAPFGAFVIPALGKVKVKVSDLGSSLNDFLLFMVQSGLLDGKIKVTSLKNK